MVAAASLALMAGTTARADYPSAVLADGPLTYHRFNETGVVSMPYPLATNIGTLGASVNGADYSTDPSGPAIGKGLAGALADPANTAFSFPGVTDTAVIVPYDPVLAPLGPFTVEFWAKPASTDFGTPTAFYHYTPEPRGGWFIYQCGDPDLNYGNGWTFRIYKDTSTFSGSVQVAMPINTSLWYHVVAVYDGANVLLYTNGVLAAQSATTGYNNQPSNRRLTIGSRGPSGSSATYPYKGLIDEYAFYTNALSADDIAAHYAAATTNGTGYATQILALNPAGYWRFNEKFNLTVTPNLGTGGSALDGTYRYNSVTAPDLQSSGVMGAANQVLTLDTSNPGYVSVPALNLNSATATFECWLKRNGNQAPYVGLLFDRNGGSSSGLELYTNNMLSYHWNDAGGEFVSGLVIPDGQWVYSALAISPSRAVFYMYDGTTWSSATNNLGNAAASFNVPLYIGSDPAASSYNGRLDEAAIYNKTLTAGQLRSHALAGFGVTQAPVFVTDPPVLVTAGTIYAGWPFLLNVDAYGTPTLSFQWRKNGANLPNATNTTYSVTTSAGSDSGNYDVIVTNPYGSTTNTTTVAVTVVTTPPDVTTGIRTWLRFDEFSGLTAHDSSGNGRDGTLQGFADDNMQWVAGLITNAIAVNPVNRGQEVVLVTDDGGLNFATNPEFTLAAWVHVNLQPQSTHINGGVIAKGNSGEQYCVDIDNGHFRFFARNAGNAATVVPTSVAPDGNWQHVCAVCSASNGVMKIYVNGVEAGSATPPSSLLASADVLSIGARWSGSGFANEMNGLIDDARVFGRALIPAEVQALYNAAPTIAPFMTQNPQGRSVFAGGTVSLSAVVAGTLPMKYQWYKGAALVSGATAPTLTIASVSSANIGDYTLRVTNGGGYTISDPAATVALLPADANTYESLVVGDAPEAYWRLNDVSGAILDSMGRHDGTLSGSAFYLYNTGALTNNADTCVYFDTASRNQVTVPYSTNLNAVPFSIECWAQYTGPSPLDAYYAPLASTDFDGSANRGYVMYATPSSAWECWLGTGVGTWTFSHGTSVVQSAWAHLVETFDGTTAKMYVNGFLTVSAGSSFLRNLQQPFYIGNNPSFGDRFFTGYIDEVACYKSVLSPGSVNAHYNLGVYGATGLPVFVPPPASQTVTVGATVTFTATVIGAPTLSYQWQKDGVAVPGATGLTLSVTNVYYTDGGHQYALAATNDVGGAVSLPATLTVMPPSSQTNLVFRAKTGTSGSVLELIWPAGTLYSAPDVTGPWTVVIGATLPYYTISPTNATMFFRRE
jgi:hypothetical protein